MKRKNKYIGVFIAALLTLFSIHSVWGAYSFQTFTFQEVLTAAKMNQVEVNIRDHVHGANGVDDLSGNHTLTGQWTFTNSVVNPVIIKSTNSQGPSLSLQNASGAGTVGSLGTASALSGSGTDMSLTLFSETGWGLNFAVNGSATPVWLIKSNGDLYNPNSDDKLGLGTDTPDTSLHVYRGSAGSITADSESGIVLEDDVTQYFNFLNPKASYSGLLFGNPTDGAADGFVRYDNQNRGIQFQAGGVGKISINSSGQLVSSLATGTAPFSVASTTVVANLNADTVDGYNPGNSSGNIPISNGTVNANLNAEQHNGLKVKVVDIGDWNMDTAQTKQTLHGLTVSSIRSISAIVRDDSNVLFHPVTPAPFGTALTGELEVIVGIYSSDTTYVYLERRTNGIFDNSTEYDASSYNRGYITIWYVP